MPTVALRAHNPVTLKSAVSIVGMFHIGVSVQIVCFSTTTPSRRSSFNRPFLG